MALPNSTASACQILAAAPTQDRRLRRPSRNTGWLLDWRDLRYGVGVARILKGATTVLRSPVSINQRPLTLVRSPTKIPTFPIRGTACCWAQNLGVLIYHSYSI